MFGKNEVTSPFPQSDGSLIVNSLFHTLQGEGPDAGLPSIFLRLSKCNLRCHFCFVPSTKILMADGTYRRIDQIKVNDLVMSWKPDGGFEAKPVVKVHESEATNLVCVNIDNRRTWCTPEHPFLTSNRGWVSAENLLPGDCIVHWGVKDRMKLLNPASRKPWKKNDPRRKVASAWLQSLWKDETFRRNHLTRMRHRNPMYNPEVAARSWTSREGRSSSNLEQFLLNRVFLGLPIQFCGDGAEFSIAHKFPDFKVEGQNKVIEVWAADSLWAKRAKRDAEWVENRRRLFAKHGYQTLFLPLVSVDMKIENHSRIRQQVVEFIHNGAVVRSVKRVTPYGIAQLYGTQDEIGRAHV